MTFRNAPDMRRRATSIASSSAIMGRIALGGMLLALILTVTHGRLYAVGRGRAGENDRHDDADVGGAGIVDTEPTASPVAEAIEITPTEAAAATAETEAATVAPRNVVERREVDAYGVCDLRRDQLMTRTMVPVDSRHSLPLATTDVHTKRRVTVMQWNTLAQSLCAHASFRSVDRCVLSPSFRRPHILQHIRDVGADLVALEELDESDYREWLAPALASDGYASLYKQKPGNADGCALFYRPSRLVVRAHESGAYNDSNQVFLLAHFSVPSATPVVEAPVSLFVAVTHLEAKPEFAERRTRQMRELLNRLDAFAVASAPSDSFATASSSASLAVCRSARIVCGDMNDEPSSDAFRIANERLVSVYDAHYFGFHYTTYKQRNADAAPVLRTIDYIFYADDVLRLTALLDVPPTTAFPGRLPSPSHPSDHLSLAAQFDVWCVGV